MKNENHKSVNEFTGDKIRQYRKRMKWKQIDLANRIGVKGNTISSYENGKIEIPHSKLKALAEVFDIKTTDLLPVEGTTDTISEYVHQAKGELTSDQLEFLQQVIEKTLSLKGSERDNFLKNVGFAVEFFNKK